jgi:hypothetical protein
VDLPGGRKKNAPLHVGAAARLHDYLLLPVTCCLRGSLRGFHRRRQAHPCMVALNQTSPLARRRPRAQVAWPKCGQR